jgi:hypothetical protein
VRPKAKFICARNVSAVQPCHDRWYQCSHDNIRVTEPILGGISSQNACSFNASRAHADFNDFSS